MTDEPKGRSRGPFSWSLMPVPAVRLAQRLAPSLNRRVWAIGGSTLLHRLGLEPDPGDLDIVTDETSFGPVCASLMQRLQQAPHRPLDERLVASHFARFEAKGARPGVDLMAGIAVRRPDGARWSWSLDTNNICWDGGLPWMHARDWLTLYDWFDRPHRVAQLQSYLGKLV